MSKADIFKHKSTLAIHAWTRSFGHPKIGWVTFSRSSTSGAFENEKFAEAATRGIRYGATISVHRLFHVAWYIERQLSAVRLPPPTASLALAVADSIEKS